MKLENERLCVEIAEHGAEVTRIYDKMKDTELLWNGDPAYWKRHSPILFPNVGKTYHNTVLINGTQYPTSQHGFARDNRFQCVRETADTVSFLFSSNEETKEVYPFDFDLTVTYRLEGDSLTVKWEVQNTGDEEMYFTIGGHPAFCFEDECCQLNEEMFENDALILDHGQISEVWLCHKDGTPRVGMKCEGFPNFGIWSVKNAPFVCLEPWMGRCDDIGFDRELSEKPDVNKVPAGGRFEQSYVIVAG